MDQFQTKRDVPLTTAFVKELVPAGECHIIARILVDIEPLAAPGGKSVLGGDILPTAPFTANWADRYQKKLGSVWAHRVLEKPLGNGGIPLSFSAQHDRLPKVELSALVQYSYLPNEQVVVDLSSGDERLLEVKVPEDLEEQICRILDGQTEESSQDVRIGALGGLRELLSQSAKVSLSGAESPPTK